MREVDDTIGLLIARVSRAHRNCAQSALSQLNLFPVQELILLQLAEQDALTQTQIAERLMIEAPTVSKMLQRLERGGLIRRTTDADDARISRVSLTADSRALLPAVRAVWSELEARTLAGLTDVEQALLRRLLLQVRANLIDG